MLGMK